MSQKQFKAESKRLLDLMINSIYTHKEIFLRELISNASDALDKRYYHSLGDGETGLNREDFFIQLVPNRAARTLTIRDNGCGMSKEELEENLGTIAKSGSLAFKQQQETTDEVDIIGQFGVGFYSAFMVAKHIKVTTRQPGADTAWCWESSGADGYTVTECEKAEVGSDILLTLKEDTEEEDYSHFLDEYELTGLVKKYSDYIRYPIRMERTHRRLKEGSEEEYESYTEWETLNSMVPIWKKKKSEVTPEDYNAFYKEKFYDFQDPTRVITTATEGSATYNALLFIPSHAPYNYYSRDYEKGLQLYASGVLIMERCADLLPDCFSFVKGLVDSQDLSLNISREMLQHDRQLKLIAGRLEKKIQSELLSLLQNDREKYEAFFQNFGLQLKYGVYDQYGAKKELLQDLLLYRSSHENKLTTLAEYVSRMKEDQKYIYYACGESAERIARLPQTERLLDQGYEILYLTDDIDEFALKMLFTYQEKEFRSVSDSDVGLENEEEKQALQQRTQDNQPLLTAMGQALEGKVSQVRLSGKLKTHPVCLTTEGDISLEMEKVLGSMPGTEGVSAKRVLELNPEHPIFTTLQSLQAKGETDAILRYTQLLYGQAQLIEGLSLEDPVAFTNAVCQLMADRA